MSININYASWENSLKLTWSKKEAVAYEASFYLKNLKFICLEIFLSYFGSSVKTTNNFARASRFFVHFFALTRRLRRELPKFHVSSTTGTYEDKFLFLFPNLNLLQESVPTLDKVS